MSREAKVLLVAGDLTAMPRYASGEDSGRACAVAISGARVPHRALLPVVNLIEHVASGAVLHVLELQAAERAHGRQVRSLLSQDEPAKWQRTRSSRNEMLACESGRGLGKVEMEGGAKISSARDPAI